MGVRRKRSPPLPPRCLPLLQCVTVDGGHFDFIKLSAETIARHIETFLAGATASELGEAGRKVPNRHATLGEAGRDVSNGHAK